MVLYVRSVHVALSADVSGGDGSGRIDVIVTVFYSLGVRSIYVKLSDGVSGV